MPAHVSRSRRPRQVVRTWGVLLCVVASVVACSGGEERSVENFCATYQEEKEKFQERYERMDTSDNATLSNLLLGIQSLGDVSVVLESLEEAAPPDIEPDMAEVAQSWEEMLDVMGDQAENALNPPGLLGATLKGALMALASQGSWTRVSDYISDNCGA